MNRRAKFTVLPAGLLCALLLAWVVGSHLAPYGDGALTKFYNRGRLDDSVAGENSHPLQIENLQADVTVDALGKTETCIAAINSLKPRGRHVQIGLMVGADASPGLPLGRIIGQELKIIGSHGMGASAYPAMLARIADGTLQPQKLIAGSIALDELPAAMQGMGEFNSDPGVTVIDRFMS